MWIPSLLSLILILDHSSLYNAFAPTSVGPRIPINNDWRLSASVSDDELSDVMVMVNGMPGPMATAAAEACLRKGLKLSPVAVTGPEIESQTITVTDTVTGTSSDVRLIPSNQDDEVVACLEGVKTACGDKNLLAIDFTHPSAVNANGLFYVKHNIPFVMGTTGGDREKLLADVEAGKHFAVIAPNMGKQIVAMQAALEDLAAKYPSAFAGYKLAVTESHQKTKADTSGTAKAVIDSLKTLNGDDDFTDDDIDMIRNDEQSIEFGVPPEGINGHAFHTYTLTSPDGSVQFQLQHNVVGRTVYAEGTADAVKFLAKKIRTEPEAKIFTMINVLEEAAME